MNTLIVPCAGKSSRFPNMKPKWLLMHPEGALMVQKALSGLNLDIFDRIIFTIVREHAEKYEAALILKQAFTDNPKAEICILDSFTKSASETVYQTLEKMGVSGAFVVKDSDNRVQVNLPSPIKNIVVGYDLHKHPNISNIPGKSFILANAQNIISDVIEKKVVSNIICLGVYCFAHVDDFKATYLHLLERRMEGEMFISHVISYMLSKPNTLFECLMADGYDDWGTLTEWQEVLRRHKTYFIDADSLIMKNIGPFGAVNWNNNHDMIQENIDKLLQLQRDGAQIVIMTSRPETYRAGLEKTLGACGLKAHAIVMGLNQAERVILKDFATTDSPV